MQDEYLQDGRKRRQELQNLFNVGSKLGYTSGELSEALHEGRSQAFIDVLMACLPNVSTLYLSPGWLPRSTLSQSSHLQKLQSLTVFGSPFDQNPDIGYREMFVKDAGRLFFLPTVRKVSIFDIHLSCFSDLIEVNTARTSSITDLTLVPGGDYPLIEDSRTTLRECLKQPQALVSLTVFLPRYTSMVDQTLPSNIIPNDELWRILSFHKHCLEYLDIYDQDADCDRSSFLWKPHLSKLDGFERLHTLRILQQSLVGGFNGIREASFRLQETLPVSIRSLTIYANRPEGLRFEQQILEAMQNFKFQKLAFLIFQEVSGSTSISMQTYKELVRVCSDRNISLAFLEHDHLPRGGKSLLEYGEAHDPEQYISQGGR
ncbi:uncharacterized protein KY384_001667 [Bacidia gigantensis]|uniref:uncharacterized protein n=1 Tax=Bacidia gigantensis TaxID=2732470 RepID=UPI001D0515A4|nr:uncharacterized protein KY384_001667 [Bacidia gigantensis]KAG8533926.1 hypothetical protein KY384_001667 [Bacidia gigantensis]